MYEPKNWWIKKIMNEQSHRGFEHKSERKI